MTRKERMVIMCAGAVLASQVVPSVRVEAKQVMVDAKVLEQLQQLIADQQQQLNSLQKKVDQFQQTAMQAQVQAQEAKSVAEEAKSTVRTPETKVVTSGQERVKLAISGQINRAVNIIDDGGQTDLYFVDNANSNSRIRFVGTAKVDEDLDLGARYEMAFAPNESSKTNQNEQEASDFIDERYADLSLASKRYGKLYLGKGDTASNNSAEVDLSGTDVVQYSSYADIAGGMLFRRSSDGELTNDVDKDKVTLSNAFNNFDGLSRKSRLRYDLPTIYGFTLAGSAITDSRWDTALTWSGSGYGFKMGAAAAVAYINTSSADYQYDGSFSVLHEDTGLNFTFSAGARDDDNKDDAQNLWTKLGWQTQFFTVGKTNFGLEYGMSENLPTDNDDGDMIGAAVVQNFADYGTELYLQYRHYSLDREVLAEVEDMDVGTVGARVKF